MKNYILAWRNLWRNRRRTIITAASVFFAVFFALIMRSLQNGSYDYMYKNVIESYSGYIQVQQTDWWDEKTLENSFTYSLALSDTLMQDPNVEEVIPRLETFALASSGNNTKGVMIMGIDPQKESLLSNIGNKVVRYHLTENAIERMKESDSLPEKNKEILDLYKDSYYSSDERILQDLDIKEENYGKVLALINKETSIQHEQIKVGVPGVWIGAKLASYLELTAGDTLVLIGQGYHGTTAAGKYEIKGLINLPVPDMSSRIVYLPYNIAQELFNTGDNLTSVVLHLNDNSDKAIAETIERVNPTIPENTRTMDWREMNEVIIQQMQADNISGKFMIGILYLVIGFGIFGTVLMMTSERRREFGVLVAIGMQRKKLATVMSWEMLYIGLLGILAGMLIATPLILIGVDHPIVFKGELAHMMEQYDFEPLLAFQPIDTYYLWQMFVIAIMVAISLMHPLRKILKLKVVNALRA